MGNNSVLIGEYHPWESTVRVGSHHYAKLFLQAGWRVGYISHAVSPVHMLRRGNLCRFQNWISGGAVSGDFFAYVPLTLLPYLNLPGLRSEYVAKYTLKLCIPPLKGVLAQHGLGEVKVLFVSDPVLGGLAGIVGYECFAFRVHDRMGAFRSSPPSIRRLTEQWVMKADLVFATSERLCEELEQLRDDVVYLPNACDYKHFAAVTLEPAEYKHIPRPRVVYVGAIADWFDVDLVSWAAKTLPHISFVLIGPVTCALKDLRTRQNVYVLGPRSYAEVPAFMQHADVGVIPFLKSDLTDAASPIKLFEYCAAGLSVVTTALAEASRYANKEFVLVAKTREEFVSLLQFAVEQADTVRVKCKTFARQNSWSERFARVMTFLERW